MTDLRKEKVRKPPTLAETLTALRESENGPVSATVFYGLSGISDADLESIKPVWEGLDPEYRAKVMKRLEDVVETNVELDYHTIGVFGLEDDDAEVRAAAIGVLWEDDSLKFMKRLIEIAQWDENIDVRATAFSALGRFILKGELGELPESETSVAQDVAVSVLSDESEDVEVRRRALEAIANSSHEIVEEAIKDAYFGSEQSMRISAIFAMGRTCDMQWEEAILKELRSDDPEMRFEAARASGDLELSDATPYLVRLAQDGDREIREAAIWSLGEIGGREATRALTAFAEEAQDADDEDLVELIEDAIGNATLAGGDFPHFGDFERE